MKSFKVSSIILTSLWVILSFTPVFAQGSGDNPFAPLQVVAASRATTRLTPTPSPVRHTERLMQSYGELTGVVWHSQKPVAIVNGFPLTVGSRFGQAQVNAIGLDHVVIVDEDGETFTLYLVGGLAGVPSMPLMDPNLETMHVHVEDVACRIVLEALAYQADLNLVFVGENDEPLCLHLQDISWEGALQAVLRSSKKTMIHQDGTITIQDQEDTLATETFSLNYGKSADMEAAVNKLLSEQGMLAIDNRLNTMIVTDTVQNLERVKEAIQHLDQKAPQVLIEVLIVNVILTDERKMGVDWQVVGLNTGRDSLTLTQELGATTLTNPYSSIGFYTVDGNWSINGLLDFVQNHENVTVLANPKVLVLSNQKATIDAVEEIPYQKLSQTGQGTPIGTTDFKEAGVKLEVTPQITEDGYIVMHILPEQSARVGTFTVDGTDTPVIETRKTETNLRVKDGQTVIIGGLRKREPFRKESRLPVLGDLPLVGKLFRQTHVREVDSELGVFITPHIYREEAPSGNDLALVETEDDLEALWDKKVMGDRDRKSRN